MACVKLGAGKFLVLESILMHTSPHDVLYPELDIDAYELAEQRTKAKCCAGS